MQINNLIGEGNKKELLHALTQYCIGYLGLSNSSYTVTIMLSSNLIKEAGAHGLTAFHPDNAKEIIVCIDSRMNEADTLRTFSHEMVHVKQLAKGQLRTPDEKFIWLGKDCTDVHYLSAPWELEALSKAEIIYRKFVHAAQQIAEI